MGPPPAGSGRPCDIFHNLSCRYIDSLSSIRYNTLVISSLRLHGISMAYGPRVLFSGIDTVVAPGQCLVVTGANGAGKSSLLKIVARLLRPEAGKVEFDGKWGCAAPDIQLYGELTGDENLAFFARLLGVSPIQNAALLTDVGLPPKRGRDLVSAYSSGMRQRLKLATSLLGSPPLLLWDEPTATLDTAGRAIVGGLLSEHLSAGGLAVVATNDPSEAESWGDLRLNIGI